MQLTTSDRTLPPAILEGLRSRWLEQSREMRAYYRGLSHRPRALHRRVFQLAQAVDGAEARAEVIRRLFGRPQWGDSFPAEIRAWLESMGLPVTSMDGAADGLGPHPELAPG